MNGLRSWTPLLLQLDHSQRSPLIDVDEYFDLDQAVKLSSASTQTSADSNSPTHARKDQHAHRPAHTHIILKGVCVNSCKVKKRPIILQTNDSGCGRDDHFFLPMFETLPRWAADNWSPSVYLFMVWSILKTHLSLTYLDAGARMGSCLMWDYNCYEINSKKML